MSPHLITRATILGTGLIGGSFALALRKYATDLHISGWDRPDTVREARARNVIDEAFATDLASALRAADLIYIALPIGVTIDLLPELARSARADADLFRNAPYALVTDSPGSRKASTSLPDRDPRVSAFLKLLEKIGARPLWLGAQQHDYAVGMVSHLPQLAAVALGSFLYDHLDENGLPITVAGPGLRDSLRLAGSPYSTWRDIVLTNREVLSAALDLFARRLDDLRERLNSRELEADFDAANELYKLLRSL